MILHWPQITILLLYALNMGAVLTKDTKTVVTTSLAIVINLGLMYAGGFFG